MEVGAGPYSTQKEAIASARKSGFNKYTVGEAHVYSVRWRTDEVENIQEKV